MSKVDRLIADARRLRDDAIAKMELHKKRIAEIDALIDGLKNLKENAPLQILEEVMKNMALPSEEHPELFSQLDSVDRAPDPDEVAENAKQVLLMVGKPLKRGQLVREMTARNYPLSGKDRNKNLGTILWRRPKMFVSLPKLGYWVKDTPLRGVYEPKAE